MTDWRELERARVASGVVIYYPQWQCDHMAGDRAPGYNGVGLRRNMSQNAHSAPAPRWTLELRRAAAARAGVAV